MRYWLVKSEPDVFGFHHLMDLPEQTTSWDGVRNYQARNFLRDEIAVGDRVLFYHSSCSCPGIVGITAVVRAGYPDATAFDPTAKYYDPGTYPAKPRWYAVDLQYQQALPRFLSLAELKTHPELSGMPLLARGNRLSVMPVTREQWQFIVALSGLVGY